jgi:hypothetical protein
VAGVIFELDGAVAQPPVSPVVGRALPIASAIVAAVTLFVSAGLHDPPMRAPSARLLILEEVFKNQSAVSPTLELRLPQDLAAEIHTREVDGVTGLARSAPTLRSFRIRGSNTIVIVACITGAPAIVQPTNLPVDVLFVHGVYAANYSVEAMSLTAVRWTENGMTYEVASRSLLLRELVALAEQVR